MHAPVKKTYIRANQKNFMDKELNQAIMVRSKLRNKFLKLKIEENMLLDAKQHNYYVKLLQQNKRQCFENLNLSCISDSYSGKQYLHFSLKKMDRRATK